MAIKCKFCYQSDLTWYKDEDGSFHLIDTTGARHTCKGQQRNGRPSFETMPEPIPGVPTDMPTTNDTELLSKILIGVNQQIDTRLEKHNTDLLGIVMDGMKQLANAREKVVADSVAQAIIAAEARIPIKHYLEIKTPKELVQIDGHPHKLLPNLVQFANARLHVFMVGPAGSGKTTAGEQCSKALGLSYYEASMGPSTSQWDLAGYRSPDGKYVPGIMREPYEKGGILMLDEIDNSNPSVLTTLNSALSNQSYTFPDMQVKRHKDFVCIAAGNTYGLGADRLYVGRNQLDAATLDRFATINWDYDEDAEKDWAGLDQLSWTEYVQKVRHICQKHQMRVVVSPRASIFGAKLLRCNVDRNSVAEAVLWKGISREDRQRISGELSLRGVY